jgi:hypothetical protein
MGHLRYEGRSEFRREAAGDYLPRLHANNKRSVNLIFNTPSRRWAAGD